MKLNIPEQTPPDKDDFPNHPKKVKKWLAELKRANMGDFTRQIYNGLVTLNRQSMSAKYRLENMEILREPSRHILFNYINTLSIEHYPYPVKARKLSILIRLS